MAVAAPATAEAELRNHRAVCALCAAADGERRHTEPVTAPTIDAPGAELARGLAPGDRIDRYLVLGRLGRGGMGEVLRAYDPSLKRELAVKVVRVAGVAADEARARLLREAQALARLTHPNVITVHDVGTRGDEVFVAMELVEGATLRRWLDERPTPEQVLTTFLAAGEGLAAAHDVGLVHRDFKPENVMVGADGRVRVLDFGLARDASAAELAGEAGAGPEVIVSSTLTATGAWMGTPRYMAPEQWRREPADARSDQFSFCVALYEALYHAPPFAGATVEEAVQQALAGRLAPVPADAWGGDRLLQIIARGLAAAPAARHPSMRALLGALALVLPSRQARRRTLAAGAALAGAALVGLVAWQLIQPAHADPCANAAARVDGTWSPALRRQIEATFATAGLPGAAAPLLTGPLDRRADELRERYNATCKAARVAGTESATLMDLRMRCLERRLGELGAFVEQVAQTRERQALYGSITHVADLPPTSACDDGDALARLVPPPDDPRVRARVAELEGKIDAWRGRRHLAGEGALLDELAAAWPEIEATGHAPLQGQAMLLRGALLLDAGKQAEAAETLVQASVVAARAKDDHTLARLWTELLDVDSHRAARAEALALEPVALAAIERIGGAPELTTSVDQSMGWVLRELARHDEARLRYEAAIARLAPAGDSTELAQLWNGLGVVAKEQGRYEDARSAYEQAIAMATRVVGDANPLTATFVNNLAVTLQYLGKPDEALASFERVHEIYRQALPPDHPDQALPLANMCGIHAERGQIAEARGRGAEAIAIWTRAYGPRHRNVIYMSLQLATLDWKERKLEQALASMQQAIAILEEVEGADSLACAMPRRDLAELLLEMGRPADAVVHSGAALAIYTAKGKEARALGKIELSHGRVLWANGHRKQAVELVRRARDRLRTVGAAARGLLAEAEAWLVQHRA